MPRIPVRVEPYTSAVRQQRHFKSKRDIILRQLGKASYINGSQFAIMWITARGEPECYGTPAFQPKLEQWFNDDLCADAIATLQAEQQRAKTDAFAAEQDYDAMLGKADEVEAGGASDGEGAALEEVATPPFDSVPVSAPDSTLSHVDVNASDIFMRNDDADSANTSPPSTLPSSSVPRNKRRRGDESHFETEAQVVSYLSAKVNELSQTVCKIVVRSWIKIIEPKKPQTHPYQQGELSKPNWWPHHVRHKEPDSLLKPERIDLIVGILLSPYATMSQLAVASGEYNAFITPEKHAILRDIYAVARAYETMLSVQGDGIFVPFTVTTDISAPLPEHQIPASPPKSRKRTKRNLKLSDNAASLAMQAAASPSIEVANEDSIEHHVVVPSLSPAIGTSPWTQEPYYSQPLHSPLAAGLSTPWSADGSPVGSPYPHHLSAEGHSYLEPAHSPYYEGQAFFSRSGSEVPLDADELVHDESDMQLPTSFPQPSFVLRPPPAVGAMM